MERERLKSRLGFILLSAGCAIGIGNVWKFPYIAGQYGGGLFVLIYLFFLVVLGIPVMTMEFSLGRASQKSPARMYHKLAPSDKKWRIHGYAAVVGNYILMMFYTTVGGLMIKYFVDTISGKMIGLNENGVKMHYDNVVANPNVLVFYMAITVVVGFIVCSFSLQKGLERVTKYMMIALLAIMIILAINSIFMKGGQEGLKFYLVPNFELMNKAGLINIIVAAMNQSFFTLSLGMGAMAVFGSYIGKERSLMGESIYIASLDTFVAFTAGLIIFPACFTYDVPVNSGPELIFITLPNIFNNMSLGRLWGGLFFLFMSFAALSTVFAVFENIISCFMDITGINRKKSCLINGILMFILSLPCALGFNLLSGFKPFGGNSTIMDLEDFIVNNILLPLGSFAFVLFCTHKEGWGFKNFKEEANKGKGVKVQNWMRIYMTYVLPAIILLLFIVGIINFFNK